MVGSNNRQTLALQFRGSSSTLLHRHTTLISVDFTFLHKLEILAIYNGFLQMLVTIGYRAIRECSNALKI
jgi:hypothetical protein